MNYDYLVFTIFNDENFSAACQMVESMMPGIKKTGSLDTVDGPIQNYSIENKYLSVYGSKRDNAVTISSNKNIPFLQRRSVDL